MPLNRNYWGSILQQVQIGTIAVLTILGLIISDWVYRDTQERLFSELTNTALLLDTYFKQSFYHWEMSVSSVGYRLLDIKGPHQDSLRLKSANRYITYYTELTAFGLADTTGYLTTFTGNKDRVANPNLMGSGKSKRSFLLAKKSKNMVIGEAYFFEPFGEWVLPIRLPLTNKYDNVIALITSTVDYNELIKTLEKFNINQEFRVHMVDADFNTTQLYYPLDEKDYNKWLGKDASLYVDTLFHKLENNAVKFSSYNLLEGFKVLGVKTAPGLFNQYLLVSVNKGVLTSRFLSRIQFILLIYVALVLVTIFGFRYLKEKDVAHSTALNKERMYADRIIRGSPSMIVGVDAAGICRFANPTTLNTVLYKESEIVGKEWWKTLYPSGYYNQVIKLLKEVEKEDVHNYEMTFVRKDGVERVISWNTLTLLDESGNKKEIVGFGHDVTELKKAQKELNKYTENLEELVKTRTEELTDTNKALVASNYQLKEQHKVLKETLLNLEKTQKQLFQADKMASLGILLAGVGHEINNPLNFINGGIQGLKNLPKEADAKPFFDIIEEGVKRAANIVKSLSHFSRKTGKLDEPCDIHLIVDNCLTILHNKLKHKIEVEKSFSLGSAILSGSEGKLHQAILNILSNAEQAIEEQGKISISTYLKEKYFYLSIKDTGMGILKEDLSKIGDPFFTTKEVGKGTGLGLSITYSIMEEHGGRVDVSSEIGKGTEFILIFPVQ